MQYISALQNIRTCGSIYFSWIFIHFDVATLFESLLYIFIVNEKTRDICLPFLPVQIFLVGVFSFKEKSPTITVGSFFSFSADNLTLNGPLFLQFLHGPLFLQYLQSYNLSISYNS